MSALIEKVEFLTRDLCPLHAGSGAEAPDSLRFFCSVKDNLTGRNFRILRCATCGVGLTDPYPSEATVKWLYEGRDSVANFDPIRRTVIDRLKDYFACRDIRRAHSLGGGGRIDSILDFGAGNGRFCLASKRVFPGCHVDAVDFDREPPPGLIGIDGIRYLTLEAFRNESKRYDLILLRHVLEHVHNPDALLWTLAERLSAGGVLYIEVPNIDSAHIYYFGKSANGFSVPYHLFHFDAASLQSLIHLAGLSCEIFQKGLPLAGSVLASLLKQERNFAHQLAGVMLHPVQMVMDRMRGKFVLVAVCKRM